MYNQKLHFHFTGIGGSGMSGLAEILLSIGFKVSGSDLKSSSVIERLRSRGAVVAIGHSAQHVPSTASLLVYSSAVGAENPELLEARRRKIPVVPRAEVLAELMRLKFGVAVAGSHGKTTTTSMTAAIMERGGLDPTVIIGGQLRAQGSGARLGKSEYLVAETDESDRSFLLLKPTIAVVTNIDAEHLNAYSSIADLEESFERFANSVPFYGLAVLCIDDPKVRDLAKRYNRRSVTYGLSPDASLRAEEIVHERQGMRCRVARGGETLGELELPMLGKHMLINSLAAVAVGLEFNIPFDVIRLALGSFGGVKRRLEVMGEVGGVTIMNDYGHHPTEVRATLRAIRAARSELPGKIHVVFQPHRYSRTRDCFAEFLDAFQDADAVLVTDIYAASEEPIEGVSSQKLCEAMTHANRLHVPSLEDVPNILRETLSPEDLVLCLGAGSIGQLPERLLLELAEKT